MTEEDDSMRGNWKSWLGAGMLLVSALAGAAPRAVAQAPNLGRRFRALHLPTAWALIGLLLFVFVLPSSGQGSRKQDIVLNRFGQPVAGATITVCTAGATGTPCSPLANIFSNSR
jgi:putative copper export protein